MAKGIPPESKRRAKELFFVDGLDLEEIACLTGIPVKRVEAMARSGQWREKLEAVDQAEDEIRQNLLTARALALRKLLAWEGDKDTALALSAVDKLEKIALASARHRPARAPKGSAAREEGFKDESLLQALPFENMPENERISRLEEGINRQIAHLLQHPVPDLSGQVKGIKAAMDVLASLKGTAEKPSIRVSFDE